MNVQRIEIVARALPGRRAEIAEMIGKVNGGSLFGLPGGSLVLSRAEIAWEFADVDLWRLVFERVKTASCNPLGVCYFAAVLNLE